MQGKKEVATLAGGCFWCLEAIYKRVKGIIEVIPGYSGGGLDNPSYEQVCSDTTGHAEAIQIFFNPEIISYNEILEIFWQIHNPTTLNRQGNDIGSQYRSVILYHNEEQKKVALISKKYLQDTHIWQNSIVTEIVPFRKFYPAEEYHRGYYENHPENRYCQLVVKPKVKKYEETFKKYTR
ncbi:MAG: peptide-methionine (S)-S-oxide reductase MsrA [Atribacterota bacterium]|jgi:peptide-methionine (S)-S-oxide reductase|nr:peptide-methionine (S)-S-oxide reductase MsrA [Atribacterota bacterium]MDD4895481.1 peptide-methionine (S)-S-oxide reductase MsrA [Atribacterota bacterium]MDD5637884.1 peptide-methionine (S)-S-oxide reductase MsrA [Atribacterota bacterium]